MKTTLLKIMLTIKKTIQNNHSTILRNKRMLITVRTMNIRTDSSIIWILVRTLRINIRVKVKVAVILQELVVLVHIRIIQIIRNKTIIIINTPQVSSSIITIRKTVTTMETSTTKEMIEIHRKQYQLSISVIQINS